jgi:nucleoside-diphosphate-sugar epimerase
MDLQEFYNGKKIVVTGGASFIGSHLTESLVELGSQVIVVDNLSSGSLRHLAGVIEEIEFHEMDARDTSTLGKLSKNTDVLFHLAATHGGRGYIDTHPVECISNMALDYDVFSTFAKQGTQAIVHASSACTYPTVLQDSETELNYLAEYQSGFKEPGQAFPDGEYGWAKLMGELQLKAISKQYGTLTTAARIFTAYGERENLSHAAVALIAKAMLKLDPFPIWGNGEQTRNFTYVKDTVKGILIAGANAGSIDALNVGTSQHVTINEIVKIIFDCVGWSPRNIDYQLEMPVGVKSRASDNTLIKKISGWEPATSIEYGVKATYEYLEHNRDKITVTSLNAGLMER